MGWVGWCENGGSKERGIGNVRENVEVRYDRKAECVGVSGIDLTCIDLVWFDLPLLNLLCCLWLVVVG